ncbi:MAG: NUDIX hydrolase [Prevotella sp.]|nr:NUDIX hydrolase [Prevotella sp.]
MEELKYHYKYPHPNVTTDCVVFGFDGLRLNVLLIERGADPFKGHWAFPGGFLNIDESAQQGARRELFEETGLRDAHIRQFHTFSAVNRDPRERVISIAYYALVRISEVKGGDDAAKAQWFPLDSVPPLAFDHEMMLRMAIKELRRQIHFEPIGLELLPEKFTMTQLRHLYEAILNKKCNHRHFSTEMLKMGLLTQLNETKAANNKATSLYKFDKENYNQMIKNSFHLYL